VSEQAAFAVQLAGAVLVAAGLAGGSRSWFLLAGVVDVAAAVAWALVPYWPLAWTCLGLAVACLVLWLLRRRRKRAPRSLGAKTRARLAALVKSMPRAAPRLRPPAARA